MCGFVQVFLLKTMFSSHPSVVEDKKAQVNLH